MDRHLAALLSVVLLGTAAQSNAQGSTTQPVKIFILAGQSNMVGQGNMTPATAVNTLEHLVNPVNDTAGSYQFLVDGEKWRTWDDVWIDDLGRRGSLTTGYGTTSNHVGPEIGFGYMASGQYENQVLVIKCAWGGKSLVWDFLPPSAGSYPTPQGDGDKGFYYAEILRLVSQVTGNLGTYFPGYAGQGFEIAGFGWHQGYNDRTNAAYSAAYETNMAHFIRNMRSSDKELDVPGLPFVIDTTALPGIHTYEMTFTIPGDPCDPNTTIEVEYGDNLAGWNTALHDGDNVIIGFTEGSPKDAVEVKLNRATRGAEGSIFVRLKVSVSP